MKRRDLVQTLTFLANVSVIVGIVLLASELRQNTVAVRSEASQGIQSQIADVYSMIATDRMAAIYIAGQEDPSQLDAIESVMFNAFISKVIGSFENLFALVKEGSYDESRARGYWQLMRNLLAYPGMRKRWVETRYLYNDAFRAHVENEVMTLDPSPGTALLSPTE